MMVMTMITCTPSNKILPSPPDRKQCGETGAEERRRKRICNNEWEWEGEGKKVWYMNNRMQICRPMAKSKQ